MTATPRHRRNFTGSRSLQLTVIAFCAGLLALMWIGLAYQLSFERDYAIERRESENGNLARLF